MKIYDGNDLKYEVVNDKVYDSNNNFVYEISNDRVYDAYGNRQFEIDNGKIYDDFGNRVYEVNKRYDGSYGIYDNNNFQKLEVYGSEESNNFDSSSSSSSSVYIGSGSGGIGTHLIVGIIVGIFAIVGPIVYINELFRSLTSGDEIDGVLFLVHLMFLVIYIVYIKKNINKKISIQKSFISNYTEFLLVCTIVGGSCMGSFGLLVDLSLSKIKSFIDVVLEYLAGYFMVGIISALPLLVVVYIKYKMLNHKVNKKGDI